jgi:hypothetical protein
MPGACQYIGGYNGDGWDITRQRDATPFLFDELRRNLCFRIPLVRNNCGEL